MIISEKALPPPPVPSASESYRFKRGSKLSDMPPLPPLPPVPELVSLSGPFQLAEYLSLKVMNDPHDIQGLVEAPVENEKPIDQNVWIYEHLRRIPIDATPLITQLLSACSRHSCPQMKAQEWLYLCVAHVGDATDKCCAIDYILHTLDSTTALLNSTYHFPSRLSVPAASLSHFPSLFRRLSRIFSHAFYHHREIFATAEAETSLYARFVALCERYKLVGSRILIIPRKGYEMLADEDEEEDDEEDGPEIDTEAESNGAAEGADVVTGTLSPSRGRDKEDLPATGRSHSLGRHPVTYQSPVKWTASSPVQPANKGKPAPAQQSQTSSPPSGRAATLVETPEDKKTTPRSEALERATYSHGTLSRGKAKRSAMLWSADQAIPPDVIDDEGEERGAVSVGMARSDSFGSVVHIGPDSGPDSDSDSDRSQLTMPPTPSLAFSAVMSYPEQFSSAGSHPEQYVAAGSPEASSPAAGSPSASPPRTKLGSPDAASPGPASPQATIVEATTVEESSEESAASKNTDSPAKPARPADEITMPQVPPPITPLPSAPTLSSEAVKTADIPDIDDDGLEEVKLEDDDVVTSPPIVQNASPVVQAASPDVQDEQDVPTSPESIPAFPTVPTSPPTRTPAPDIPSPRISPAASTLPTRPAISSLQTKSTTSKLSGPVKPVTPVKPAAPVVSTQPLSTPPMSAANINPMTNTTTSTVATSTPSADIKSINSSSITDVSAPTLLAPKGTPGKVLHPKSSHGKRGGKRTPSKQKLQVKGGSGKTGNKGGVSTPSTPERVAKATDATKSASVSTSDSEPPSDSESVASASSSETGLPVNSDQPVMVEDPKSEVESSTDTTLSIKEVIATDQPTVQVAEVEQAVDDEASATPAELPAEEDEGIIATEIQAGTATAETE